MFGKVLMDTEDFRVTWVIKWFYYRSKNIPETEDTKNFGKWMFFFDKEKKGKETIELCKKAVKEGVVEVCKHTECLIDKEGTGVCCFYCDKDDMSSHKRILKFFLDNNLIPLTKDLKLYNISFKLNEETRNKVYGSNIERPIKLENFVNLYTYEWLV